MKHKNNDIVAHIFLAVVGVIFVGIIIYYSVNSVKSTTRLADSIIASSEKRANEHEEYEFVRYDGESIRGSELVNFIKKQLGDFSTTETAPIYVEVVTKASSSFYTNIYTNNQHIEDIRNFSSINYYIKPTAIFTGEVIRTGNDVIIGVKFSQK